MRHSIERALSRAPVATVSALLTLGLACHLDAVLHPPTGGGPGARIESLEQVLPDSVTPIPIGGSAPVSSIVVRAVVHDTAATARRVEVELQPAGTPFKGQATGVSDPTPSGKTAYVPVAGLADNTSYHWQARVEGDTLWQTYGDNDPNAVDFRVVLANHLEFTLQPTTTTAGSTIGPPIEVTLVDGHGGAITTFTGTVVITIAEGPAGAVLSGNHNASAVSGVARFSGLSINRAGDNYRLGAGADGVAGTTSAAFGINPGPAYGLTFTDQPTTATRNAAITPPVVVTVLDAYGNTATGFSGTVFINMGTDGSPLKNAALDPNGTHGAVAGGIATFPSLRINQVGLGYTLSASASVPAIKGALSDPFDVTP